MIGCASLPDVLPDALRGHPKTDALAEATVPQTRVECHVEWEPLLLAGDYAFVYFDGVNRFYLANEHADADLETWLREQRKRIRIEYLDKDLTP